MEKTIAPLIDLPRYGPGQSSRTRLRGVGYCSVLSQQNCPSQGCKCIFGAQDSNFRFSYNY